MRVIDCSKSALGPRRNNKIVSGREDRRHPIVLSIDDRLGKLGVPVICRPMSHTRDLYARLRIDERKRDEDRVRLRRRTGRYHSQERFTNHELILTRERLTGTVKAVATRYTQPETHLPVLK